MVDAAYVNRQITRLDAALATDPELAIGTAKEFVETISTTVLRERGVDPDVRSDFPKLVQQTMGSLHLLPAQVDQAAEGGRTMRMVLQSLVTLTQGLAELRGKYGTGHGKQADARGLEPRHARLAVHSAVALASFLFESSQGSALPTT